MGATKGNGQDFIPNVGDEMRIGIFAAVVLSSTIALMPSALAQMTPREHEGEPPPSAVTFPRNSCPGRMLRFVAGWEEGKAHEAQATQRRTDHLQAA